MQNTEAVWRIVEDKQPRYAELSDRVWDTPELNYAEHRSAAAHGEMLAAEASASPPASPASRRP
jgi:aminobenzoyl-glutamate utilization protein B